MKIEVLEERLRSKDRVTGQNYDLEAGDRVTVSDETGEKWCAAGWVKDLSGNVETGERVVRGATLNPANAAHKNDTEKAGG